jgi:3-hydroxyisobutyrate dehydrogenase-like beta-hydroxyacid dehydrogenase
MPVFELWGKTIVVAGDRPGAAQTMKLTNNLLCAVALVATSEAMTMSREAGIPADAMLRILNNGTGRNFATMHVFPETVLPRTFDFGATIEILMKDVDLAIAQFLSRKRKASGGWKISSSLRNSWIIRDDASMSVIARVTSTSFFAQHRRSALIF